MGTESNPPLLFSHPVNRHSKLVFKRNPSVDVVPEPGPRESHIEIKKGGAGGYKTSILRRRRGEFCLGAFPLEQPGYRG